MFGGLTNPAARISGNTFGSSIVVQGDWISNDAEVLQLAADREEPRPQTGIVAKPWQMRDQAKKDELARLYRAAERYADLPIFEGYEA